MENDLIRFNSAQAVDEERARQWEWQNDTIPRLKAAGFEARYWKKLTEWHPDQQGVFEECQNRCKRVGAIIALIGPRGTGKTTICGQMAIARAENPELPPWERQPPYRKATDIIARYKPLYADFGSTEIDSLMAGRDALCRHPLLFIDELHECNDQRLKDRAITDILDRRYSKLRDTILVSNQTPEEFNSTTSDSVLSRISEHGLVIECVWPSFRSKE